MKFCLVCGRVSKGSRCTAHGGYPDGSRGTSKQRGYDAAWHRRVKEAIALHPWCSRCGATTDLTGDHPVPLSRGGGRDQWPVIYCRKCNAGKGNR